MMIKKINIKNKKNMYTLIAIGVVIILLGSVLLYSLISILEVEEKIEDLEPTVPITRLITKTYAELEEEGLLEYIDIVDDSISPLAPQAIFFEVKRIRHRGFYDIITGGRMLAWRQKPQFYYTLTIDDFKTYNSKDIYAPSGYEEVFFTDWDTMFQETRRVQGAMYEEQETSDLTFTIFQRERIGIFGLRTVDREMEQMHLTYCYRTGRWTGDNYFGHPDGYGNYVGEKFEIWFDVSQSSYALDGIPYWTKVNILGLDPLIDYSDRDLDGDGIPVLWEWKWGYDPFTWDDHANLDPDIDGLNNLEEYKMHKYFANPFKPDIYIEADGMKKSGLFGSDFRGTDHIFYDESVYIVTELFSRQGINLYIDNGWPGTPPNAGGELLDHVISVCQDSGIQLRYYEHHFPDERKGIFRYFIVSDGGGHAYPSRLNRVDTMVVGTNLRGVLLHRNAFTPRTRILTFTSLVMHELGHTLGLLPWSFQGVDNYTIFGEARDGNPLNALRARRDYVRVWGGYESSMNYLYAMTADNIDYSDGSNGPPYDQNDWHHIYLPYFKLEADAIEEPRMYYDENFNPLPAVDVMQNFVDSPMDLDIPPISSRGYTFDENLTLAYLDELKELIYVSTPRFDISVYVDENTADKSNRNVRVYAKPDLGPTHYSEWSLIAEGYYYDSELVIAHGIWNPPIEL
jgi:hypothetical protein